MFPSLDSPRLAVWQVYDPRLDRAIAIKVMREGFTERFEREAKTIASINHPHVCTLHDVGPNYLVMEYIDGRPIKGPRALKDVLRLGRQICDGLETDAASAPGTRV